MSSCVCELISRQRCSRQLHKQTHIQVIRQGMSGPEALGRPAGLFLAGRVAPRPVAWHMFLHVCFIHSQLSISFFFVVDRLWNWLLYVAMSPIDFVHCIQLVHIYGGIQGSEGESQGQGSKESRRSLGNINSHLCFKVSAECPRNIILHLGYLQIGHDLVLQGRTNKKSALWKVDVLWVVTTTMINENMKVCTYTCRH